MAVPDFQSIMLPLLRFASDGEEHAIRDAYGSVADQFSLSEQKRKELLPSGKMPILTNRVQWAKTYLVKAGILASPRQRTDDAPPLSSEDPRTPCRRPRHYDGRLFPIRRTLFTPPFTIW